MLPLLHPEDSARARPWCFRGSRIVIGVPGGITAVEKRAVRESAESAGAREVYRIKEPMAIYVARREP